MAAAPEVLGAGALLLVLARLRRRSAAPVRLLVEPYRNDRAGGAALAAAFTALHSLIGTRRTLVLEVHLDRRSGGAPLVWFAVLCPRGLEQQLQAALRAAYPNVRVRPLAADVAAPPVAVVLRRRMAPRVEDAQDEPCGGIERLLAAMAAAGAPVTVRLALRPASRALEHLYSRPQEPIGPLWWGAPVVLARDRARSRAIASTLSAGPPRLVAQLIARTGGWSERPRLRRSPRFLYRPAELAGVWSLPAPEFAALPCLRSAVPLAPAPPRIERAAGDGLLRDENGAVTIAVALRRQHTAVVGAVDQGKTSFLVASAREDLRREDCAVIVLDPKGDAAQAIMSVVPATRTVTLLDMAAPRAGFNPLAVEAAPDAIADQVVASLRGLFSEGEVRGSSDRYLRNAVIAALACGAGATLWDAARLLEVGEEGRVFRAEVAERLVELPSYAELARFFAHELPAQLADARATTTAKLDAPSNKLARVLNSPAVKRVLLNDSLRIDLDRVIARSEVLVVRGALGEIGPGNVAVLMQLLLGMLDAALSRIQDRGAGAPRRAVALKVDEAPLAINVAFAQTLALKRSAGLETVACWQTDAQWDVELREQLDALFAHRVLFATASAADARNASALLMADFSDQIRAGDEQLATLASPDVRLHLPRHTALASWTTPAGRERPFLATTLPLSLDRDRIESHARAQEARGGRELHEPAPPASVIVRRRGAIAVPVTPTAAAVPPSPVLHEKRVPSAVKSPLAVAQARSAPRSLPDSYSELLELDGGLSMRLLAVPAMAGPRRLAVADRELLTWLAAARCALTTQIHRRFHPDRSLTVTQRQLKRLADRGLIARFQLYRDDGGGIPLCCAVTEHALELVEISARSAPTLGEAALPGLRADAHLTGWLLALEQHAAGAITEVLGPGRAAIVPGRREAVALELERGLRAREFLLTQRGGGRVEVERFAPLRPDAVVSAGADLLIVSDPGPAGATATIEAYDHLVSGWWRTVERYRRSGVPPQVVFVCADEASALTRAGAADALLTACHAEIGASPGEWARPGRAGIHFAVEADAHRGLLVAWRVPALPRGLRTDDAAPSRGPLLQSPAPAADPAALPPWR